MSDADESCVCCMSRPRAVRNQPCGHAVYCELCTTRAVVQDNGLLKCGVCRSAVQQLVVVPPNPAGDPPLLQRMQTHQLEPEPESCAFESVDAFLLAQVGSDDDEGAEAARAALARVSEQGEEGLAPVPNEMTRGDTVAPTDVTVAEGPHRYWCTCGLWLGDSPDGGIFLPLMLFFCSCFGALRWGVCEKTDPDVGNSGNCECVNGDGPSCTIPLGCCWIPFLWPCCLVGYAPVCLGSLCCPTKCLSQANGDFSGHT